jgi:hypothetical protein
MKVIGKSANEEYIITMNSEEINEILKNAYTSPERRKIQNLNVGDVVDLAIGYKFSRDITRTCEGMVEAYKKFEAAQNTMMSFARLVAENSQES